MFLAANRNDGRTIFGMVTTESLMKGVRIDPEKYTHFDMAVDSKYRAGGTVTGMSYIIDIEMAGDINHVDMEYAPSDTMRGYSLEYWTDSAAGIYYGTTDISGYSGGWIRSAIGDADDAAAGASDTVSGVSGLSDGAKPVLLDHGRGEDYVVLWSASGDALPDGAGASSLSARAVFDGQTRKIKSISMTYVSDYMSYVATYTFYELNAGKALAIPADVIAAARSGSILNPSDYALGSMEDYAVDDPFGTGTASGNTGDYAASDPFGYGSR